MRGFAAFPCKRYADCMSLTRTTRRQVPSFSLYGERAMSGPTDSLHIEDIQSRSRKYLWKIGTHRHAGLCQCVYLTTGDVVADLEQSRTTLKGPVAMLVPAGTVHAFAFRAESQGYVLTFDITRVLAAAGAARQAPIAEMFAVPHTIDLSADPTLAARAGRIFESLQPDAFERPVAGWLACAALWVLAEQSSVGAALSRAPPLSTASHDLGRLWRFRQLIELHYLEHWSVERYARRLALSETSLNRLCQRIAGTTAFEVIQQRLALEARRRLTYVPLSVAAIAAELGFKDPAYFSRFFRKHSGMSPSVFRRRQEAGG
jgi:AraC family transcriptional activator of pobA